MINILCDHCLLVGYADQVREVDRAIVERGIQYLEDGALPKRRRGSSSRNGAALVAVGGGRGGCGRRGRSSGGRARGRARDDANIP